MLEMRFVTDSREQISPPKAGTMLLQSFFISSKHSFFILLDRLRNEEEIIQQKYLFHLLGYNPPLKRTYINMENRVRSRVTESELRYGLDYLFLIVSSIFY